MEPGYWINTIDSWSWVISPAKKDANPVQKKIQVKDWLYLHWLQVWPPNVSEWVGQWLIDSDFGNSDDDNHNACTM